MLSIMLVHDACMLALSVLMPLSTGVQVPPVTGVTIEEQPLLKELDQAQSSSSGSPVVSDDDGDAEEGGSVMVTDDEEGADEGGSSEDDGEGLDEGPPPLPGPPAADDELQVGIARHCRACMPWQSLCNAHDETRAGYALERNIEPVSCCG